MLEMIAMKILIGCEYSGVVRDALIAKGHDAISCDLLPSEGKVGGGHYQGDILEILHQGWDMMIAFPECKFLCGSGLHWNNRGRGWEGTEAAMEFVKKLFAAPIEKIAIENSVGIIGTRIRPPDQTFNPYDFGDNASKRTCLWLKGLPLLVKNPAMRFAGRLVEWPRGSGKFVERWGNQTDSGQNKLPPSATRGKDRAKTYQGPANAMAEQWG